MAIPSGYRGRIPPRDPFWEARDPVIGLQDPGFPKIVSGLLSIGPEGGRLGWLVLHHATGVRQDRRQREGGMLKRRLALAAALVFASVISQVAAMAAPVTPGGSTEVTVGSNDAMFSQTSRTSPGWR